MKLTLALIALSLLAACGAQIDDRPTGRSWQQLWDDNTRGGHDG